jgi:thiol:disulfide interchange protein
MTNSRRILVSLAAATLLSASLDGCKKAPSGAADFEANPSAGSSKAPGKGIAFASLTYDEALSKANAEQKFVMIDFYTDWCGWCKKMDQETFTDERVGKATRGMVPIRVNAEKGGADAARKYRVDGFPVVIFLDGKGREIQRIRGFVDADEMLKVVEGLPRIPA